MEHQDQDEEQRWPDGKRFEATQAAHNKQAQVISDLKPSLLTVT